MSAQTLHKDTERECAVEGGSHEYSPDPSTGLCCLGAFLRRGGVGEGRRGQQRHAVCVVHRTRLVRSDSEVLDMVSGYCPETPLQKAVTICF